MATSKVLALRRAFVTLLLSLATFYGISLTLNRDSGDDVVLKCFKQVAKKAHPDKGGKEAHIKKLNGARDAGETARKVNPGGGRPQASTPRAETRATEPLAGQTPTDLADPEQLRKKRVSTERVRGLASMLTYFGIKDHKQWERFVAFVRKNAKRWGVKHWSATLEKTRKDKLHVHLYVQFTQAVDKTTRPFVFEGLAPKVDDNDLPIKGLNKRNVQESINRGFFYVYADKIGTQRCRRGRPCVAGNYWPVWESHEEFLYPVNGKWAFSLWHDRKLTEEVYEDYLFKCRDSVVSRKRNLDACREHDKETAKRQKLEKRAERIRGKFQAYPPVPTATKWQRFFKQERDRYPILIVYAKSFLGKTEWAKALFPTCLEVVIGSNKMFPNKLREFDKEKHACLVLDDIRDCAFLTEHQDKIQGKSRMIEFASTQAGQYAYELDLSGVPIICTINDTTKNLDFLQNDGWLGEPKNREIVRFYKEAWLPRAWEP